jgi:hypothetical protein
VNKVTVLYYTANREDETFEAKIRQKILENKGDLPLISVSQKPLDFGENICVGEHDMCYANEFRQIQIGLKQVKTPFVIVAEADTLYPSDYFSFVPTELHGYRYDNTWIMYHKNPPSRFHFKGYHNGAEINYIEHWLPIINKSLEGRKEWSNKEDAFDVPFFRSDGKYSWTGNPVINFKTKKGIRNNTKTKPGASPRTRLPYWGRADELRKQYFEGT